MRPVKTLVTARETARRGFQRDDFAGTALTAGMTPVFSSIDGALLGSPTSTPTVESFVPTCNEGSGTTCRRRGTSVPATFTPATGNCRRFCWPATITAAGPD